MCRRLGVHVWVNVCVMCLGVQVAIAYMCSVGVYYVCVHAACRGHVCVLVGVSTCVERVAGHACVRCVWKGVPGGSVCVRVCAFSVALRGREVDMDVCLCAHSPL